MSEDPEFDIGKAKASYLRMQIAFFAFMLFVVAGTIAGAMTQRDWPLNFVPFVLVTWIWSAVAMNKLAAVLGRSEWVWGSLAIFCPVLGALIGYVFIGRPAKKLISQIRWKNQ